MATFGVLISNRSFFPSHLVIEARVKLLAALERWGHTVITLSTRDMDMGQTMTYEEAQKCGKLFYERREEMDGIIIACPTLGKRPASRTRCGLAGQTCPSLYRPAMMILTNFS